MDEARCVGMLTPHMQDLREIWTTIGLSEPQRARRVAVMERHITSLLTDMVGEERALKEGLIGKASTIKKELAELGDALGMSYKEPPADCGMLSAVDWLSDQLQILNNEKTSRLDRMRTVQEEELSLCEITASEPYYIPSGSIPTDLQLSKLKDHTIKLRETKTQRMTQFLAVRVRLRTILSTLGESARGTFEEEVIEDDPASFLLSPTNMTAADRLLARYEQMESEARTKVEGLMDRLESLWSRLDVPRAERDSFAAHHSDYKKDTIKKIAEELERMEKLKFENIQKIIHRMRGEITDLWEKSYYSLEQKDTFTVHMDSEDFTEDLLAEHESEVEKVRAHYDKHLDMFKKIEKRKELWEAMLEFDKKDHDPNRYNNRGGNLLKEEKERKKVLKQLPKVEEQLKSAVEEWEMDQCELFLMEGLGFTEYCEEQWRQYHQNKETEKAQRLKNKEKEMQQEVMYGSKAATPAKRRFCGVTTPARTPKLRKMDDTTSTTPMMSMSTRRTPFTAMSINRTPQKEQHNVFASPALPAPNRKTARSTRKVAASAVTTTPRNTRNAAATPTATTPGARSKFAKPVTPRTPGLSQKSKSAAQLSVATEGGAIAKLNEESMLCAPNYGDFKKGIHSEEKINFRSSSVDLRTSSRLWK